MTKKMPLSTLVLVMLIPVLITGCEGARGGDWGGTALTAFIEAFSEALRMIWLRILQGAAGLIVVAAMIWFFLRKK